MGRKKKNNPEYTCFELDLVWTAKEVCDAFGLSESTVRKACQRKAIPCRKAGNTWLVSRLDAEKRWGTVKDKSGNVIDLAVGF